MRIYKTKNGINGFTLLEVMVASAVFAVGMLGVFKMMAVGIVANRYAKDLTTANLLLQKQIEMVSREAFNNVVNGTAGGSVAFFDNGTNGDVTSGDGIFTRQFTQNGKVYTLTLRSQQNTPRANLETITGTASWTDMGSAAINTVQKTRRLTFTTYKSS